MIMLGRPFTGGKKPLIIAMLNESLVSVYLCLLMCLTDHNAQDVKREEIAFALLGIVFLGALLNLINFAVKVIVHIITKIEKMRARKTLRVKKGALKYL